MKMILIGARGVGKTSLLQRLQIYLHSVGHSHTRAFDLDREIERAMGLSVAEIFAKYGEEAFREFEISRFRDLTSGDDYVMALGAGFPLDRISIPENVDVIWVRRPTDNLPRVFMDRPRLSPEHSAGNEYLEKLKAREPLYQKFSNRIYELPEGLTAASEFEKYFFLARYASDHQMGGGIWTLQNSAEFCPIDADYFEVRDDLEIPSLLFPLPERMLFSFRKKIASDEFLKRALEMQKKGALIDWPVELGQPRVPMQILSLHERLEGESLSGTADRLLHFNQQYGTASVLLKLAVKTHSFAELQEGLKWQREDPEHRSFLPRSDEGRWRWYRLWARSSQKLNFIGTGLTEVKDQPSLYEWMSEPEGIPGVSSFAAVLGDPVFHSYSPIENSAYFKSHQAAVYSIQIHEEEWPVAIPLLLDMGLKWVSVTSPHKRRAASLAGLTEPMNTLYWTGSRWLATNTDEAGFRELADSVGDLGHVAVWGGGGTLQILKSNLPGARFFSASTGLERDSKDLPMSPDTLVWAASPQAEPPHLSKEACRNWKPQTVIDLNYRDDSRAKEYCQSCGARYISGLMMFKAQAQGQRTFWEAQHGRK